MGSLQLQDFVAGLVGGVASVVVGHPLDTVKNFIQLLGDTQELYEIKHNKKENFSEEYLYWNQLTLSEMPAGISVLGVNRLAKTRLQAGQGYGNTLKCFLTVYRNESATGFFKGMSFPMATTGIYSSVVFGVFSSTQRFLSQLRHGDPAVAPSLTDMTVASSVAGFVSVAIGTPVDLVKIRLQMQTQPYSKGNVKLKPTAPGSPVYRGPIHCFWTILQKEGIAGIYRGTVAMLLRDVPGYCVYFIPYAVFCDWTTPEGCVSPSPFSVWLAGGIAGAISWGLCTPMDVVKSRLQADGVYLNQYKGTLDCILQSYQNEGLKVFFRGLTVNTVRGFPSSAAMFLGYELSLKAMKRDQTETNP